MGDDGGLRTRPLNKLMDEGACVQYGILSAATSDCRPLLSDPAPQNTNVNIYSRITSGDNFAQLGRYPYRAKSHGLVLRDAVYLETYVIRLRGEIVFYFRWIALMSAGHEIVDVMRPKHVNPFGSVIHVLRKMA